MRFTWMLQSLGARTPSLLSNFAPPRLPITNLPMHTVARPVVTTLYTPATTSILLAMENCSIHARETVSTPLNFTPGFSLSGAFNSRQFKRLLWHLVFIFHFLPTNKFFFKSLIFFSSLGLEIWTELKILYNWLGKLEDKELHAGKNLEDFGSNFSLFFVFIFSFSETFTELIWHRSAAKPYWNHDRQPSLAMNSSLSRNPCLRHHSSRLSINATFPSSRVIHQFSNLIERESEIRVRHINLTVTWEWRRLPLENRSRGPGIYTIYICVCVLTPGKIHPDINSFLTTFRIFFLKNPSKDTFVRFWIFRKNWHFRCDLRMNPGKMVPKNGPREKWSPENYSPENWSPQNAKTKNRRVSVEHRGVCVCVWNVGMWSIYVNPKLDNKHKTRNQTQNSETKNRGVSVEHRGMCVECSDVINLWNPKTRQQTFLDSFSVLQFGAFVGSWGKRQTCFCVCSAISR